MIREPKNSQEICGLKDLRIKTSRFFPQISFFPLFIVIVQVLAYNFPPCINIFFPLWNTLSSAILFYYNMQRYRNIFIILFYFNFDCMFSITIYSLQPSLYCNYHTIVHVHEFFFLFAQPLHPLMPPPIAVILLSISLSLFGLLLLFVH